MRKFSSGLHKDVPTIFEGVWNPATDNFQPSFETSVPSIAASVGMQQMADRRSKESAIGTFLRACKDAPGFVFRSRARRERKRLTAISKHLMINIPS